MPLSFPSSPSVNDTYTVSGRTYIWDGTAWRTVKYPIPTSVPSLDVTGDLTSDTDTLYIDSTNDRVGIGTSSPATDLDVVGTTDTDYLKVAGQNVTPYTGKRNLLINGAMQVYQRASSGAVGASEGYRCADRWKSYCTVNAGGTLSVNTTDAPEGFNNSLNYACSSAEATATNETFVSQVLEGQDVQHIGYGKSWCKEVTVSFWVKSNVTGTFNAWFFRWDGSRHIGRSYTINSADTWEYKTVLVPAETSNAVANDNSQGFEARFYLGAQAAWTGGTEASSWSSVSDGNRAPGNANINSSTSNYWRITGVQVEVGDKATPFEHRSFGEELVLCHRYYYKGSSIETATHYISGVYYSVHSMPQPMRANPTITLPLASSLYLNTVGSWVTGTSTSLLTNYGTSQFINIRSGVSTGFGVGSGVLCQASNFEASAEL
jgi:hypothetical protein